MLATQMSDSEETLIYEIRLKKHLENDWDDWFGAVTITLIDDGTTMLTCNVIDQAELYGILRKVRDLGLTLISVQQIASGDDTD